MSNANHHPSLPARPPPSTYSAAPHHNNASPAPYASNVPAYPGFMPRTVASRASGMHMSGAPTHAPMMAPHVPFNAGGYQSSSHPSSNAYYQQQQSGYGTPAPPVNANPYTLPGAAGARGIGRPGVFDPEEEARIAEWSSFYTPKDDGKKATGNANGTPLGVRPSEAVATPDPETKSSGAGGKEKTVVRQGGGKSWEDPSLLEWDPTHPRLFIGNLAGEVTDDSLLKAFAKYPSVEKARVVRDKKTTKSKSFGFVSFTNTDDFFRAAREMEGKYIGSHPVRVSRATTEVTATTKRDNKHGKNNRKGGGGAGVGGRGTFGQNGVQKSQHKGKSGGPRLLG